jgi:TetR/AcrR family transcriptional regulator, regulator of cefoperazone and chloramphenicol sensitivity
MLSMRSVDADLTARARIRDAAIAHFAEDGFQRANLRAIAATAGVSSGLVVHHFGSKERLREACDEHVLGVLVRRARDAESNRRDLFREYLADPRGYRLHLWYMTRAIQDDTPAAGRFVDTLVEEAEAVLRAGAEDGSMRPSSDPRALAVLTVLTSIATLTMPPPFARALGRPEFGPDVLRRLALPTLELYTYGLYADDTALHEAKDAVAGTPRDEDGP